MISIRKKGNFNATEEYFKKAIKKSKIRNLDDIAIRCIDKLKKATPSNTGVTADSWSYEIKKYKSKTSIVFNNSNVVDGVKVVLLLEFGHASRSGNWIKGENFIEPIVREAYNEILKETWKELTD